MRIAIIEPRSSGCELVIRAQARGHQVVLLTADSGQRQVRSDCAAAASSLERIDTNDDHAVLARLTELHEYNPFDAVIPGFEHYVPTAAAAACALGLPGLDVNVALRLRHKYLMREALSQHGMDQPGYVLVADEADVPAAVARVGLPCVVKPVDQSGSRNVSMVDSVMAAVQATRQIRDFGKAFLDREGSPLVLIEELVSGPEFSVEGYVHRGTVVVVAVTEKSLGPRPWFVEVGHLVPARLDAATEAQVCGYTEAAIQALGLELGPFHLEVRCTGRGPLLIEAAARLGGDRIPDLVELATGVDLYGLTIDCHLGLPVSQPKAVKDRGHAGIRYFVDADLASYRSMRVNPAVLADKHIRVVTPLMQPGVPVPAQGSSDSRLGYAMAYCGHPDDCRSDRAVLDALGAAERGVSFQDNKFDRVGDPMPNERADIDEPVSGRHVLIVNRWANRFAEYHRYIDHRTDRVSYLTTPAGQAPLDPSLAEEIVQVSDLSDHGAVSDAAVELARRYGPFSHVLALSEFDLELGAELRERLDVAGKRPAQVQLVRDKIAMKQAIAGAGLRVPRYRAVDTVEQLRSFAVESGFPFVLKPRAGADSQGVHILPDQQALEAVIDSEHLAGSDCEEFIEGNLYQVDGVVVNGKIQTIRSWSCIGSCLDFARGAPFGSIANDDADFEARVVRFAERVLTALGLVDEVFHLEVFREAVTEELVFLEIGARAGGGQVRYVWQEVYGLDLIEASVHVALSAQRSYPRADVGGEVAGYLMMPEPPIRPCTVHWVKSLVDAVPEMYVEELPPPGTVLAGSGGAVHTAGVFRFRAATAEQVQRGIERTVKLYEIDWSSVESCDG